MTGWLLRYDGWDPAAEALRETLCALGNGRFVTRAAAPERRAGGGHYPGTYAAGVFNRLADEIDGHRLENESIVNLPDWQSLTFRIEDGPWLDLSVARRVRLRAGTRPPARRPHPPVPDRGRRGPADAGSPSGGWCP